MSEEMGSKPSSSKTCPNLLPTPTVLTPLWCSFCRCYVPSEREPHVSPAHRDPHHADFADEQEWRQWMHDHPPQDQ